MQTHAHPGATDRLVSAGPSRSSVAIEILGLRWRYSNNPQFLLSIPNLSISSGQCVGIVGVNGSGKTTLINCLNGLIPRARAGIYEGSVRVFGKDVAAIPPAQLPHSVGTLFSDPECQFTAMTVEEEIIFGLENLGLDHPTICARVKAFSERLGIAKLLTKSIHEISGGQKQRVALASVLAMTPPILLLDEPTSMLDPVTRRQIFRHIQDIKTGGTSTILVAEHNLEYVAPLVDRFIQLKSGSIAIDATPREFFRLLLSRADASDIAIPDITLFSAWLQGRGESIDLTIEFSEAVASIQSILDRHNNNRHA